MLFQPRPRLVLGKGGRFTLIVATSVPSASYYAGAVRPGLPAGAIGIPDVQYFTLEVSQRTDVQCVQMLHDVFHVREDIALDTHRRAVGVAVSVDGRLFGSSLANPPPPKTLKAFAARSGHRALPDNVMLLPESVSATVCCEIGGNAALSVFGSVVTPAAGCSVRLEQAGGRRPDPASLVFELVADERAPSDDDQITTVTASYLDQCYAGLHSDVTIVAGATSVTLPILRFLGSGLAGRSQGGDGSFLGRPIAGHA
jgi:hypothetical protein